MWTHNENALRVVGKEVQNPPALLQVVLGVGAKAPHQVRELDAVPDEENLQTQHQQRQSAQLAW